MEDKTFREKLWDILEDLYQESSGQLSDNEVKELTATAVEELQELLKE